MPNLPTNVPVQKLMFQYDGRSRRIHKKVNAWDAQSSVFSLQSSVSFHYDGQPSYGSYGLAGWNLLAEPSILNPPLSIVRSYVWGFDLSGSEQGAGGIGGLLWETIHQSPSVEICGSHFVAINGNVTSLLKADSGQLSAEYEHGPFGETIRATGPAAAENVFRFSAKYTEGESGLLYYGYRYRNLLCWLSRDPIEEKGGLGLYSVMGNNCVSRWDPFGEAWYDYIPIVGTITTRWKLYVTEQAPGTRVAHYRAKVTTGSCCQDRDIAEYACARQLYAEKVAFAGSATSAAFVKTGVDVIVAGLGLLAFPEGLIFTVIGAVDGYMGISDAAEYTRRVNRAYTEAVKTNCDCTPLLQGGAQ